MGNMDYITGKVSLQQLKMFNASQKSVWWAAMFVGRGLVVG